MTDSNSTLAEETITKAADEIRAVLQKYNLEMRYNLQLVHTVAKEETSETEGSEEPQEVTEN